MGTYGIVLLAAGSSSRLGKPKQLLLYKGETLLSHGIQLAKDTCLKPVMVVLGAGAEQLEPLVSAAGVNSTVNNQWQEGMASSIRSGLQQLLTLEPGLDAVIIMVCDQPFVTEPLLKKLVTTYESSGKPIIASSYANVAGTPVLFDKKVFAALLELKGNTGAKQLIKENPGWVELVDFPQGNIDIDTEADYESLLRQ